MKPRFPLFLKITAATFFVVLTVIGFLSAIAYRDQYHAVEEKFGLTLQHVAQTAALFVDGDALERIHGNADAAGADFQAIRGVLERVRRENGLAEDQIYTLRPTAGGKLGFVVMLQAKTFVGDTFTPAPEAAQVASWTLADGVGRHTGIYTDAYGSFVSGFAPVRDHAGRVVGLLEVDYGVDRFLAEFRKEGMKRVWTVPAALVLALLLSLAVSSSLTRAVQKLVDGTREVQAGRYDRPVQVRTRDELRTLADAFNHMLAGLRERFAMLKFVPRHTRAVIADAVRAGGGDAGFVARAREVAVFFSDIRGFTSLSDALAPARVVEMLNIYLRAEAEIIERHGGSIDKYIGDAVMAVFEGADRYARAVAAAVEIQAEIARLNREQAFDTPIDVGIGIAGGEVVMGSVGYEDRMEFAVIGRIVNLASRLTGVAQKREIVVSDAAWQALGGRYRGERVEGITLKGFAQPQTCWRLSA